MCTSLYFWTDRLTLIYARLHKDSRLFTLGMTVVRCDHGNGSMREYVCFCSVPSYHSFRSHHPDRDHFCSDAIPYIST